MTTKTLATAGQSKYAAGYHDSTTTGETFINKGTLGVSATQWGVELYGTGNTMINYGVITGQGENTPPSAGVGFVNANNVMYNKSGGTLGSAYEFGFYSGNNPASRTDNTTLINAGVILGASSHYSVNMEDSGIVTNLSTGTISQGIVFFNGYTGGGGTATSNVSVVNSGKILGTSATGYKYSAIYARNGGNVTNLAGTISGNTGVYGIKFGNANTLNVAGTITNAATISGGTGDAILMAAIAGNRVIDQSGGVFTGTVDGGANATMELASSVSAGILTATSGQFTHFSSMTIDAGAQWTIKGDSSLSSEFATIAGFTVGDTISLTGLAQTPTTFASSTVNVGGTTHTSVTIKAGSTGLETLNLVGSIASGQFSFTAGTTSTLTEGTSMTLGHTISTTYSAGVTITNPASNPLTVTSTGVVGRTAATGGHAAIYAAGGANTNWTITNSGHISGTAVGLFGINLGYFGPTITSATIVNASGGVIAGQQYGIITDGATTITNQTGGTLSANGNDIVFLQTQGTVFNYGLATNASATGLYLQGGGVVVNEATGTISLNTTVSGIGVRLNAVGTVTNAGTIIGGTGGAVGFEATSSANRLIAVPGAKFVGGVNGGTGALELASAASTGTLANFSSAGITNFDTLTFDVGAKWTVVGNTSASGLGTIAVIGFTLGDTIDLTGFAAVSETFGGNALTLTNAATAHATLHIQGAFSTSNFTLSSYAGTAGTGIAFGTSSSGLGHTLSGTYNTAVTLTSPANNPLTVLSSGVVTPTSGGNALYGKSGAAWTITNSGLVNGGTSGNGIQLGAAGNYVAASVITNQSGGTIGGAYGIRIYNNAASGVTNQAGASITATQSTLGTDSAVYIYGSGTVTNFGSISAPTANSNSRGVFLVNGGAVINNSNGTIAGGVGVILDGIGTVTNAGTIRSGGTTGTAVDFASSGGNRLIVDPGAMFYGGVAGGNGTLELASAASAGTLTATGFTGFNAVDFDTGSQWTIAGSTTALVGTIAGFTIGDAIDLTGFAAVSATYASGALTLTNSATAHTTLHFSGGSLTTSNFQLGGGSTTSTYITFVTPASALIYGQTIDKAGIVASSETVTAGTMTLKNAGGTSVGTLTVGTSLSTGDFALKTDGSGGTDVIVTSVFGTYASGVTLLTNPTTITATGKVSNAAASGVAVSGPTGTAWTVTNLGSVAESGATTPIGISLAASGTVINSGSVSATTAASNGVGVSLAAGGVVTNQSGGAISGPFGVQAASASATVVNAGTISGTSTAVARAGVKLSAGGSVTNQSGGTISGFYGVWGQTDAISVVNQGVLTGALGTSLGVGVYLAAGGSLTNAAAASISGGNAVYVRGAAATVQNAGIITGNATNASNAGVYLKVAGSSLTNQSGGTITGFRGVADIGATVVNAGSVGGNTSAATGAGVLLNTGGALTNQSGGTITGFLGVYNSSGAVTVVNAGDIAGNLSTGKGISLKAAGTVTNQSGGTISGGAGAVQFAAGVTNLLVAGPGAVFTGTVTGGNTIGAASISTLELASGASAGTLTGLGSQFIDFAHIAIDAGASWTVSGTNALAQGITLTDSGTLTNSGTFTNAALITGAADGLILAASAPLTNQTGGTISGSTAGVVANAAGSVANAGIITGTGFGVELASGGTVTAQSGGTISSAGTAVSFGASHTNRLVIYQGASFTGQVDGGNTIGAASISTLELASSASAGTLSGLGTQFVNFAQITVDTGAQWTLSGTQTGFATLTNAGSLGGAASFGIQVGTSATGVTVVNSSGGAITGSTDAIYVVTGSGAGTVSNSGRITGGTTGFAAINLSGGGSVSNATGGTISGHQAGVFIAQGTGATVSNAGSIGASQAYGIWLENNGTVTNQSAGIITGGYLTTNAAGVYLGHGGAVTNQSGGTIGGLRGVYAQSAAATVVNAGHLVGGTTTIGTGASATGEGVYLGAGGTVTNQLGGTITGYLGVEGHTAITVLNAGSIGGNATGSGAVGVYLGAGGSVTNQSGGTITGYYGVRATTAAANVVNAGVIAGNYTSNYNNADGVYLGAGGSVTNQAGGAIFGRNDGVLISGAAGTVLNLGSIHSHIGGYGGRGVSLDAGGVITNGASGGTASTAFISGYNYAVQFGASGTDTLINYGTISGLPGTVAVSMATGTIINGTSGATGALIQGGAQNNAVLIGGAATVLNYATITGSEYYGDTAVFFGISLAGNGSVASTIGNLGSSALITNYVAVYAARNATVTNAGTLSAAMVHGGTAHNALIFGGGTNRLIVDPGAVFIGGVNGGGAVTLTPTIGSPTVLGTANGIGTTTLELASAASAGTLAGFGTTIDNFASLVFDSGARWTVKGNASAAGLGTLGIGGFTFGDTIDLTGFVAASRTFTGSALVLTNAGGAHQTLAIASTLATGNFAISSYGTGGTGITLQPLLAYAETLDQAGILATTETVTAGTMTLKNGGGTVVGTLVVGTSLSSGDFSLATDGAGGTNVVVHTATGTYTNGVTLSVNPSTIGSVATISGTSASAAGVSGPSGTAWTLTNLGHISETGTNSAGVSFAAAGTITNAASGSISGAQSGIALAAGGSVTNLAGGTIAGLTGIRGVGAAVTVVNTGSIGGTVVTATSAGITLSAGGAITNQTSGAITGYVGIEASGTAITMVNAGSVGGNTAGGEGVLINAGGTVTNTAGATLSGHDGIRGGAVGLSTIVNAGVIKGVTNSGGHGIILNDSGYVSNQSGGTIIGYQAVLGRGTPLTVINAGSIGGNTTSGTGVTASAGGTITNAAGGRITGYLAVLVYAGGTVLNAGVIAGGTGGGQGINLPSGGTVTAQAGTISGGADAVLFAAGYTGRLLFNPGAVFTGTVDGGNTIGATSVSTLELTSAAGAGTLSGLGTKYIHFVRTTIDAGANWTLSGANTLVAGATLTNSGTLTDTGTLVTGGTLTGNRARLSGGTLTNLSGGLVTAAYLYGASAGGADTVVNLGHITGGSNLAIYLAAGGAVSNAAGGSVSGGGAAVKIKGTAASVLNLGQIASTATDATGYGVYLRDGGVITNGQSGAGTSTAAITGYYGLSFKTADVVNAQGTLVNYGTVRGSGTASSAVLLSNAGNVFNGQSGAAAALIEGGRYGVSSGAGTVVNDASIIATGTAAGDYGIAIPGAGNVSNLGSAALIEGYGGVLIGLNGTITNGGTIESNQGAGGVAIRFTGGNARLIDEPGAVFTGSLYGGSGGTAVLELGSAATAGTISGFGTTVTNFTSLVFDTGARWTVKGNNSANGLGTIGIAGFTFGDTIDLTGIAATGESFGGNVLTLTAGGTTQATLHIAGAFSTDEFLIASDGSTGTDITLVTPPTVVAGGTVGFTGGGAAVTLNGALSLIDTAATLLASGTVVIGGGFLAGDTLNFINQNNIAGNFNTATGTLTLSGVASLADYQAALDSITYGFNPSFGDPTGGGSDLARTIDWMVNDGSVASNIGTSTVTVTHVPPVLTAGGSVTFDGGGAAVTLDGSLSLSDTDSGGVLNSGTVSIVGFVVGDILSANTTGLAISTAYNPATGVLTLSGIDTLADYQAVLRSVSYSVDPADTDPTNGGAATTRTIDWSINDGATISNPGTSVLNLVHTAPAITAGGTVSFTGGGGPVVLDSGIIVTDVDSGGELTGATIAVGGGFISGDTLKFVTQNGITGGFNGATGVLTLSGTATIAEYETALASVTYSFSPANSDPTNGGEDLSRGIDWSVTDGVAIGNIGTSTLDALHAAPTLTAGGTVSFTGGGAAVVLDSAIVVSDVDSGGDLEGATITIATGRVSGDTLTFSTQNGITGGYDGTSGVLTLSGIATVADYQTALDSITYGFTPADADPTGGGGGTTRTIDWVVTDGVASSAAGTSTLTVTHVAPVLTAGGTATFDGGGAAVTLDGALTLSDVDSGGLLTGGTVSIAGFVAGDILSASATEAAITVAYDDLTGVLTLSGTDTLADYQTALRSVGFSVNPANTDPTDGGAETTRTIDWSVNDGVVNSNLGTSALNAVHVASTVTSGGTVSFTGGGGPVVLDSGIIVTDADSGGTLTGATIAIGNGHIGGDTLNFVTQDGITGAFNGATGVLTLSGTATIAEYETALASVTYSFSPANGDPTDGAEDASRVIDWSVNDGVAIGNIGTSTLDLLHAAPTITAGATASFTGGAAAVALDSAIGIFDVDSGGDLDGATIAIATGRVSGDTLIFSPQNGITGLYNATTGTLTLQGVASLANYQTALDSITYGFSPANADPTGGGGGTSRTIDWVVNDGAASSAPTTSMLTVTHVAPVLTAGGTVTFDGGGLAVTLESALTLSDADSGGLLTGGTVSIAGFIAGDILSANATEAAISTAYNAATGVLSLSGTDTVADYQTVLRGVSFSVSPADTDPTDGGVANNRTIDWSVNDGVAISNLGTSALNTVHVAPSIAAGATASFTGGGGPVVLDSGIAVTDADSGGDLTGATIAVASGFIGGDTLNFVTQNDITGNFNSVTGTLTLGGVASIADYRTALGSITYGFAPADGDPTGGGDDISRAIDWSVNDGVAVSAIVTSGLSLAHVAPTLAASGTVSFTGGGAPVTLDSGISIADPDSGGVLTGATIAIAGGFLAGDTLSFSNGNGITGDYNAATGVLTLSGTASIANYQSALAAITAGFSPGDDPTGGGGDTSRTIDWLVTDGVGVSNTGTSRLDTVHAAPSIVASGTAAYTVGGPVVALDAGVALTDPDSGGNLTGGTVSISGGHSAGDTLSFTNQNGIAGSFNSSTGVLTLSGVATIADYQAALASVAYGSTAADPSNGGADATRTISWSIGDGVAVSGVGVSTVGIAFSPPVIGGTAGGQTTTDEAAVSPFSGVSVADAVIGLTETVTVTLSTPANGVLSNLGGGAYDSATGVYTVTGPDAAVSAALDGLSFTPTAHQVAPGASVTTSFTIVATNASGATTNTATTVGVTAVNDPPQITRAVVNAGVPNELDNTPFAGVAITDPDVGHTDSVTVTLSNPTGGALSNLGGGGFDPVTGVYTVSGTADAVTAALDGLVFTPSPPASGFVASTSFAIAVTGPGGSASDDSISVTSVQQVLGLAATPSADDTISVSTDGTGFAAPTQGQTNQAAVTQPSDGTLYTLPTGYQAEFLGGSANAALTDSTGGSALLVGNTGNDTLSASAAGDTILGGAGANLLSASGTGDVVGVSGQSTVSASGRGDTVSAGAGSPSIMVSGDLSAVGLGSGSASVTVGGAGSNVYAGTGTANIVDTGTGNAIGGYTGATSVTLTGAASSVFGGAGPLSVDVASTSSGVAIGTGIGAATLTIGGSAASVYGGAGTLNVDVTGDGALIGGGTGAGAVTIGGANATLYGGTGGLTVDVTPAASGAVIGLGAGPAALTLGGSAARVFGGTGTLSVLDLGIADTISAGPGTTAVTGGGSGAVVVGGGGALSFAGGADPATVFGGSGSTTVSGGAGATTLYGGAGGIITFVGTGGLATYQAGSGNETLNAAGAGSATVLNGGIDTSGHDVLIGGSGNDSLFAGTGADTMTGAGGVNEFVFYRSVIAGAAPSDVIADFNAGDSVILAGYGAGAAAAALSGAASTGGNTTITLSDNTRITFLDLSGAGSLQGHVLSF